MSALDSAVQLASCAIAAGDIPNEAEKELEDIRATIAALRAEVSWLRSERDEWHRQRDAWVDAYLMLEFDETTGECLMTCGGSADIGHNDGCLFIDSMPKLAKKAGVT